MQAVPLLVGTTKDEWRAFDTVLDDSEITEKFLRDRARSLIGDDARIDEALELYGEEHVAGTPVQRRRAIASALVTDYHFGAPTEQFGRAHAAYGNPVFRYELQWPSPREGLGACHDTCLPLVFATMEAAPPLVGTGPDVTRMSEAVQDAWIAFIRTGNPSTAALGRWPAYDVAQRPTMLLGAATPHSARKARLRPQAATGATVCVSAGSGVERDLAKCFVTYAASRATPHSEADANAYWNSRPRK